MTAGSLLYAVLLRGVVVVSFTLACDDCVIFVRADAAVLLCRYGCMSDAGALTPFLYHHSEDR